MKCTHTLPEIYLLQAEQPQFSQSLLVHTGEPRTGHTPADVVSPVLSSGRIISPDLLQVPFLMPCKRTVSCLCFTGTLVAHSLLSSRTPRISSALTAIQPSAYTGTWGNPLQLPALLFPFAELQRAPGSPFLPPAQVHLKGRALIWCKPFSPVLYHVSLAEYTLNSITQGNKVEAKGDRTLGTPLGITVLNRFFFITQKG